MISIVLIFLSSIWMYKSCSLFEKGSSVLTQNMAPGLKGATITAIGSSLPEFIISFLFLFIFKDEVGFATGLATVIGSSVFNLLVIPGISLAIFFIYTKNKRVKINKSVTIRDGLFFILSLLCVAFFLKDGVLTWKIGFSLIFLYIIYSFVLYLQQRKFSQHNFEKKIISSKQYVQSSFKIVISVVQIVVACYILAESVVNISYSFELNPYFVAMILSAAATSVPDLCLSVRDAAKGNIEDSLSNAIGSNIFDLCIALGLSVFVYTLIYSPIKIKNLINFQELFVILLSLMSVTFVFFIVPKFFKRDVIFIFIGLYVIFIGYFVIHYL